MPRTAKVRLCVVCGKEHLNRSLGGWIRTTCSDECASEGIARGQRGRVPTPEVRARLAEAARANQDTRMIAQKAARATRPWAMPPHDEKWRAAHMARMERSNPMDNPETLEKMRTTVIKQFQDGRQVIPPARPEKPYVIAIPTVKPEKTKSTEPHYIALAERMRLRNPMKNSNVAARMGASLKNAYRDGRIQPPSRAVSSAQELMLFACFEKAGLPILHCGSRKFWIGPCQSGLRRNPDMRHPSERRAILYSARYWHTPEDIEIQLQDYLSVGWSILHFWEDCLKTNTSRILACALAKEFLETGYVLSPSHSWVEVRSTPSP